MNWFKFLICIVAALWFIGFLAGKQEKSEDTQTVVNVNDGYFSEWDGSNPELVSLVKQSMNDADSFEHVETRFNDRGSLVHIVMKFRGTNGFGAKVLNTVDADLEKSTRTIIRISQLK